MKEKPGNKRFNAYYNSDMADKVILTFGTVEDKNRFLNWWMLGDENPK